MNTSQISPQSTNSIYLNDYQNWLQDKNFTKETIEKYSYNVKQYGNKEINTFSITEFIKENLEKYEPNTLRGQKNALASYTKFLKMYDKVEWAKINKLIPFVQRKPFPTIDHNELELLKQTNTKTDQKTNQRNKLILEFLFYTGLRVNELINIRHGDYQEGLLRIHGKGNKVRFVLLPEFLTKYFDPYSKNYLFLTRNGKKLTKGQIRRNIKRKAKQAGIKKNISPHSFRRSLATNSYNLEIKLETIQKQLGHSSLDTTMSYIQNDFNTLYNDYSKLWLTNKKEC